MLIAVSHEGGTAATLAALKAARNGARTILITGASPRRPPPTSSSPRRSRHVVVPHGRLRLAAARLHRDRRRRRRGDVHAHRSRTCSPSARVRARPPRTLAGCERLIVAGSGVDEITARELALKIEEGVHVPVTPLGIEKVLHGHLPAADARTGLVVLRIDPPRRPAARRARRRRPRRRRRARHADGDDRRPARRATRCWRGAIALQLLTLELVHAAGTNPDLIRREEDAYRAAAAAATHVSGAPAALLGVAAVGHRRLPRRPREPPPPAALVAFVGQAAGLIALALVLAVRGADSGAFLPGALVRRWSASVGVLAFYRALGARDDEHRRADRRDQRDRPGRSRASLDGERPGALQWVGVVAALTGVVLASSEPGRRRRGRRAGVKLALLAALAIGLSLVFLGPGGRARRAHRRRGGARSSPCPSWPRSCCDASAPARRCARSRARRRSACSTPAPTPPSRSPPRAACSASSPVLGGLFPVVTVALAYLLLHERLQPPSAPAWCSRWPASR